MILKDKKILIGVTGSIAIYKTLDLIRLFIKSGAVVEYAIVGSDCVIEGGAHIGKSPEQVENRDDWGIAVVGHNVTVSGGKSVEPKQIIGENI